MARQMGAKINIAPCATPPPDLWSAPSPSSLSFFPKSSTTYNISSSVFTHHLFSSFVSPPSHRLDHDDGKVQETQPSGTLLAEEAERGGREECSTTSRTGQSWEYLLYEFDLARSKFTQYYLRAVMTDMG